MMMMMMMMMMMIIIITISIINDISISYISYTHNERGEHNRKQHAAPFHITLPETYQTYPAGKL